MNIRTVLLLIQRVTTVGIPIIVSILISRQLGDIAFGQFTVVLATVTGAQIIAEFGLDKFLPREFVERGTKTEIFRTWVGFKLALSLLLYTIPVLASLLTPGGKDIALTLAAYGTSLFIAAYTTTFRSFFVTSQRTGIIAVAALVGGGAGVLLSVLVLLSPWRSIEVVALLLSGCSLLELGVLAYEAGNRTWLIPRFPSLLRQGRQVWEFGLQTILAAIYTRVGIYALGFFGGALAVAAYSKAGTVYSAMSLVPAAAALVIYPELVRLAHQGERSKFVAVLWRNLIQISVLLVPAVMFLMFFGEDVLRLIYRSGVDSTSIDVLRILLIAYIIGIVNSVLAVSLFALHAQSIVAKMSFLSLGWCILLNLFLVPRGLAQGAAWATLLSEIGASILFLPLLVRRLQWLNSPLGRKAPIPTAGD